MRMPRKKVPLGFELKMKIGIMFFLLVFFVASIFWKGFSSKENAGEIRTETEKTGDENLIWNLDEFAVPMLGEDARLLNRQLGKFAETDFGCAGCGSRYEQIRRSGRSAVAG